MIKAHAAKQEETSSVSNHVQPAYIQQPVAPQQQQQQQPVQGFVTLDASEIQAFSVGQPFDLPLPDDFLDPN